MLRINSISVENLRSYEDTYLSFSALTVLIGENNEGKSSLLKMLDRLMQIPRTFWSTDRALSEPEYQFWYPANNARHKARRFSMEITLLDGRIARRFGVSKGAALLLRFAVGSNGVCRLNIGKPKRSEVHDPTAEQLLGIVQEKVWLIFLPPVRDAKSSQFAEKLTQDVRQTLKPKLEHNKQAGAPKEYRLAKEAIQNIQEIVSSHKSELSKSGNSPLASMLRASEVRVELYPQDIYALIQKSMSVYLSTGDHDELKVLPGEVGNGLQSLIDINLTVEAILRDRTKRSVLVIIEEPEAFLHPSAQRLFMQYLRGALTDRVDAAVLTTHSPIIVDEARYEEIVVVRNQQHFAPSDIDRASINTSLMTTSSAEVFFARTVVLVEGEGDRALLSGLFRRIKGKAKVCPELSSVVFQTTGGCTFYAPWLKLVRSYRKGGKDAFRCIWIMDGDAASNCDGQRPVLRVASDCSFGMQPDQTQAVVAFGDLQWDAATRGPSSVSNVNSILREFGGYLFSCDLEWALFNDASNSTVRQIDAALAEIEIVATPSTAESLARKLGSKIVNGKSSEGSKKHPYIRAHIAERINLASLPPEIYSVIRRILEACFDSESLAENVLKECGVSAETSTSWLDSSNTNGVRL